MKGIKVERSIKIKTAKPKLGSKTHEIGEVKKFKGIQKHVNSIQKGLDGLRKMHKGMI